MFDKESILKVISAKITKLEQQIANPGLLFKIKSQCKTVPVIGGFFEKSFLADINTVCTLTRDIQTLIDLKNQINQANSETFDNCLLILQTFIVENQTNENLRPTCLALMSAALDQGHYRNNNALRITDTQYVQFDKLSQDLSELTNEEVIIKLFSRIFLQKDTENQSLLPSQKPQTVASSNYSLNT